MNNKPAPRTFHPDDSFPCPSCRLGQISTMPMMETWGCSFCGQLFLGDLIQRSLKTVDPSLLQTWYWDGHQWQRQLEPELEPRWLWQGLSILLIVLPTSLVGVSAYLFPTEPDSFLHELPIIWTGLTAIAHLMIVLYLITEYYQVPFLAYRQALQRIWLRRSRDY